MNSKEFTYWLKGALELGKLSSLDKLQTENLKSYLDTVSDEATPLSPFTNWLKGYLEMAEPVEINSQEFKKIIIQLYTSINKINQNVSHFDQKHDMSVYPPGVRPRC